MWGMDKEKDNAPKHGEIVPNEIYLYDDNGEIYFCKNPGKQPRLHLAYGDYFVVSTRLHTALQRRRVSPSTFYMVILIGYILPPNSCVVRITHGVVKEMTNYPMCRQTMFTCLADLIDLGVLYRLNTSTYLVNPDYMFKGQYQKVKEQYASYLSKKIRG